MIRLLFLLVLAAARASAESYPGFGILLSIDRESGAVTISHKEIPGFMEAMTMSFPVREAKDLEGLSENTMVDFTVVVDKKGFHAAGIRPHEFASVEPQPLLAQRLQLMEELAVPESAVAVLGAGDAVPDFTLVDQEQQTLRFADLRGKVVALSFMYTNCRLASYCFRLSNNLGALQKRFGKELGKDLVLLTITFDPANDSPEVLARYARTWKAEAAGGWHFLTGPVDEVRRVCRMFGMNFWAELGMITHAMRTVVIDRDGTVVASLEGNEFTGRQLGDLTESVLKRRTAVTRN